MLVKPDLYDNAKVGQLCNKMFILAAMVGWQNKCKKPISINWQYCDAFPNTLKYNTNKNIVHYIYNEPYFNYKEIPNDVPADYNLYINGYFQSEKYFEHCKEEIKDLFTFNKIIQEKAKSIVNREGSERIASIHIRRTDYLDSEQRIAFHGKCTIEYYMKAIQFLKPDRCLVFSDDIGWCKNALGSEFSYSENNSNVEDLCAMSLCDDNIIANSSFSWWGSWLNTNVSKRIVAPISWFGPKGPVPHDDIYTKNMIRL